MSSRSDITAELMESMRDVFHCVSHQTQGSMPAGTPTRAQTAVLMLLKHKKAVTVKDLSERMGMTSSAATQLVNALVEAKMLKRSEDPDDRRKLRLALTSKGETALKNAHKLRMAMLRKALEPLSDNELAQWLKLHRKILSARNPA
jgi:DNA-binding MarR family transcriptional regulator